jgi:hypothetical protein
MEYVAENNLEIVSRLVCTKVIDKDIVFINVYNWPLDLGNFTKKSMLR